MNQVIVKFYSALSIAEENLTYSIICSRYQEHWVFVRHKLRETWEMPAGHIEKGESALAAAKRELYEETGAENFSLRLIADYSCDWHGETKFGRIFIAEIQNLGSLPESEIAEVKLFPNLPRNLSYPDIQNLIFERVKANLNILSYNQSPSQIHFHQDFYNAIKKGEKTQTARVKELVPSLGKGEAIFDDAAPIPILITQVTHKTFEQLSMEEVQKDAFNSKEELWSTLLTFYPNLQKTDLLMLIEFKRIAE
jgi:8-oxo-dGTP diphosphatase